MKMISILITGLWAFCSFAIAAEEKDSAKKTSDTSTASVATHDHQIFSPAEIKWVDGPPALPAGAKIAVLEGDPKQPGPFTLRLQVPDGYKIPPHTHPAVEHVTVISGTFNLGMGDKFDQAATRELVTGSFAFMPAGMKHFGWMKGETVVQVHGMGPFAIIYVNPADDPRNAKK
jgi:anti-sigma factor ChrR (cupin superfamily)